MPSKESEAVRDLYVSWTAARLKGEQHDDERWGDLTAEPRGVDYIETDAGGVPAMWLVPKGCAEDRVLLCMHGGGFVGGLMYSHRKLFGRLAKTAGVCGLVFDYRLTPQHIHPAQVDDAISAYRWLLEQGITADHVTFTGDSSGGGLAITTQLRARELGLPLPAAAMPFSPWFDMELTGASYESNRDKDAFFTRTSCRDWWTCFWGRVATCTIGWRTRSTPISAGWRRSISRWAVMRRFWMTVAGSRSLPAALASMCGSRSSRSSSTPPRWAAGRAPEADEAIRKLAEWVRPKLGLTSAAR
jgi:acetyl esterase/lipase